nr:MAG: hypothetical protein CSB24_05885 [Deltaproteobacteria bacterium]
MQQAPAGYAVNPQTGQMVYTGQEAQQVPQQQSMQQAPAGYAVNPQTGQMVYTGQEAQQVPQGMQQTPAGYAVNPQTGQMVYTGQEAQQVPQQQSMQQAPQPAYVQPSVVYMQQQPTPEQIAEQQAAAQQRYGTIVNSVEKFLEGEATVSDVVKTLYTTASQDDQLWKGAAVGAAAAVLLTSGPVKEAMGKTFGGLFPGLKGEKAGEAAAATAGDLPEQSK